MDKSTVRSRRSDLAKSMRWALLPALLLVLTHPYSTYAQEVVTTNITATTTAPLDLDTDVNPVGTITEITGGTRPNNGTNLFHSFDSFTLGTNDVAHFINNMQLPTTNIIARVIGGERSTIDGTLRTNNPLDAADPMNFGAANLWLVNPSGLFLGPNVHLEVGGSVSMSTANYLRFDGTSTLFDMLSSPASLGQLSVAPVVAFGFTDPEPPAPITVQGSMLQVSERQSLSLVGGDITIQAGTLGDGTVQAASLLAPGGHLNLVSVASPGEVLVPSFQTGSFTSMGTVTLKDGAILDVSGQLDEFGSPLGNGNSGTVLVRGGQLVMDASTILAITWGAVDGASKAVDIQVSQKVEITNGSAIKTITFGSGRGGDVQLTADTLTIENAPESIVTATPADGGGVGGDVVLNVGTVSLTGGSSIRSESQNFTPGLGQGGNVTIQGLEGAGSVAESVTLSGGSSLVTQTLASSDGGRVAITAESLTMDGPGTIINAEATDVGRVGNLIVSVQQASLSDGAMIKTIQAFNADPNAQLGPTLTVQGLMGEGSRADSVVLSGVGSGIVSNSSGTARAGDIAVQAKTVSLADGAVIRAGETNTPAAGGNVAIEADSVNVSGGSRISSQASRSDAGQITIAADALTLVNGSIETRTTDIGRGGDVVLDVGSLSLSNGATVNSSTESTGRAGDITMNVGTLSLANGSSISSASTGTVAFTNEDGTTRAPGTAGNVVITATGSFTSDASTIATSAEANHGGDVSITAHSVQLSNGTLITANSNAPLEVTKLVLDQNGQLVKEVVGDGNAGNIMIRSGSTFVMNNSSMTTEAKFASGGQITIITPEMVRVINGRVSTSVAGFEKDTAGGNIMIDPQFVIFQNSQVIAQANAGSGGAINVIAGVFIADPNSLVSASSAQGPQGTVNIQSPVQNVGGELAALSQEFSSAAALLAQQCAARAAGGKFSTFVVAAREGLPAEPGGFLASPSLTTELLGSRLSGRESYGPTAAVTGAFPEYDARPIQLAKLGSACHHQ
ncbi:MAG: filamentous hemagglutinin N-terminal domain-containing protein [Nitrospirota bacterium]